MGKDILWRVALVALFGFIPILGFPDVFTPRIIVYGLLVITVLHFGTYALTEKKIHDPNPNALIRMVMAGTMIKFLLSIVVVGLWLWQSGGHIHKPDLYWLMGVYFFFTLFDAILLSRSVRKREVKNNR